MDMAPTEADGAWKGAFIMDVCEVEVTLVLVELDDDREKLKLALVDSDREDCSDMRETDR